MLPFLVEFNTRVKEVEKYFVLLSDLENEYLFVQKINKSAKKINGDAEQMLKASSILILYNLVESSINLALRDIYKALTDSTPPIKYNDLSKCLQQLRIKANYDNFKNNSNADIHSAIMGIGEDIIKLEFSDNVLGGGGNLDRRKLEDLGCTYGFSTKPHYKTLNGSELFTVKTKRNDLAHGTFSFSDVGRDYTYNDLKRIKNCTISYLGRILKNIAKYIDKKQYLNK